ncbi:MAG: PEGA domain-containing protein [Nitrospiraceae bacterium]|nr:PEGA domain-containing protein [Nitrospiraceae bacterium]
MKTRIAVPSCTIVILLFSLLPAGCATMFSPDSDMVTIKSIPSGAEVYQGAHMLGKTPLTREFKRDTFERITLTIRKEGYRSHEFLLEKTIEGTSLFNFVFIITTFGATSWGIDAGSGHLIKYSPDSYLIDLGKSDGKSAQDDHSVRLRFVVLNQADLQSNIAAGDGEYLRAYFAARPADITIDSYRQFNMRVDFHRSDLLTLTDPVEFYTYLESI